MPEQKKKTSGTSASNKSKTNTRRSTRKSADATTDAGSSKKRQRSGSQSSASHRKRSQLSRAQEVKRLKILIAAVTAAVLIIGGLLTPYLTDEDLDSIKDSVYSLTTFKNADFTISKGKYGKKATLIGTALTRITDYLKEERLVD